MSSNFTCVTCRVQYGDGDAQRAHYKSDWHRYNLKRKVASLPPVTESVFSAKSSKLGTTTQTTSSDSRDTIFRCAICNKNFNTENALKSHLESKKHKEALSSSVSRRSVSSSNNASVAATTGSSNENDANDLTNDQVVLKIVKKKKSKDDDNKSTKFNESQNKRAKLMALRANKATKVATNEEDDEDDDDDEWESDDDDDDDDGDDGESEGDSAMEETQINSDDDDQGAEAPFGEGDSIPNTSCLFCATASSNVEDNLKHMSSIHSFFVPDLEYLFDVDGLLTYLGEKVGCGYLCLWCNEKGKAFHTVDAAQTHMRDKGHTKILHEGDALFEYADFYDYRASYPDYDPSKDTDTDMEVECGSKASQDEEVGVEEVDGGGYTLVLPSGATVGHRSLLRYYKQSLNPRFHGSNALVSKHRTAVQKLMSHYKALGWTGCTGDAAKVKAKDIQFAQKAFHKNRMQLGVKANKLQHHYREQVMY